MECLIAALLKEWEGLLIWRVYARGRKNAAQVRVVTVSSDECYIHL